MDNPASCLEDIISRYQDCADVVIETYSCKRNERPGEITLVYCSGLCDSGRWVQQLLEAVQSEHELEESYLQLDRIQAGVSLGQLDEEVFSGKLLVYDSISGRLYAHSSYSPPTRNPDESNFEVSIRGPKDGFVEDVDTNVALVRKRLKTATLRVENYSIGSRSQTRVALLYVRDIANRELIDKVQHRLNHISLDGIISSTQLSEIISDSSYSLFPLMAFTGRPDFAVESVLNGRFVLLLDGNPSAVIGPADLLFIMKTAEDSHFMYIAISFARWLRLCGFMMTTILPAMYIAIVSFHPDQLPFQFMASVTMSRLGLPLSATMEMLLLLFLLELFREAGVRLPSSIGQTLTVVGGLIVGDASIRAGLVSPSMVVVGAVTAVSGFTLGNQALLGAATIIRLVLYLFSASLGLFGFFTGIFLLVLYMSWLTSFGLPYLNPISNPLSGDLVQSLLRLPWISKRKRPSGLQLQDQDRQADSQRRQKE
ncbi:spore germination protein [Paenibacillus sp. YYML68]|uniref:spore germination protein n=1 Tax=Paenibacillus sp. YYML68 TaxID=2909250 RepID=UPI0024904C14|nr:spore germination protein [Paenibacillus sp. YYML68]